MIIISNRANLLLLFNVQISMNVRLAIILVISMHSAIILLAPTIAVARLDLKVMEKIALVSTYKITTHRDRLTCLKLFTSR